MIRSASSRGMPEAKSIRSWPQKRAISRLLNGLPLNLK
jgi:hypothetical protein